jgi:hypothetical protein
MIKVREPYSVEMQLHRNVAVARQSEGLLQRPRRTVVKIACKCNAEDKVQSTEAYSRRQTLHIAVAGVAGLATAACCSQPATAAENDFVSTPSGLSYLDVRQGEWPS